MMHKLFLMAVIGLIAMGLSSLSFAAATNAPAKKARVINITNTAKTKPKVTPSEAPKCAQSSADKKAVYVDAMSALYQKLLLTDEEGEGDDMIKIPCCMVCSPGPPPDCVPECPCTH